MAKPGVCKIANCGKPIAHREMCNAHYKRWIRYGDPLGGKSTFDGEPIAYFRNVVLCHSADECLIWPYGRSSQGYARINGDPRGVLVPRLVCMEIEGPPPTPKHQAAHSCGKGNLGCVSPSHLRWATPTENQADRVVHGTTSRGERSYHARLTKSDVEKIRAMQGEATKKQLSEMFGVSRRAIYHIHNRTTWAETS